MKNSQNGSSTFHEDRDELHYQMVMKSYKQLRQNGELQSSPSPTKAGKRPLQLPIRQHKIQRVKHIDKIKHLIKNVLFSPIVYHSQSNQQSLINKIQVKQFRDAKFAQEADIIKQKQFSFYYQIVKVFLSIQNQYRLRSGLPIFKSIIYIRSQDEKIFENHEGQETPFLPDPKYLDFNKIEEDISNTRLFLENAKPMRAYQFEFLDQNNLQFKSRGFPTSYQIEKRAQTLAKLYVLNLYREQSRKMKLLNKMDEMELNHQREIKKIKQQLEIQKLKEGELIEEMDLIKQVHKIFVLIEKKMNVMAYEQFSTRKNGQRAREIKRSLEKLKQSLSQQPSAKVKLRMLIAYKHKKGW